MKCSSWKLEFGAVQSKQALITRHILANCIGLSERDATKAILNYVYRSLRKYIRLNPEISVNKPADFKQATLQPVMAV